MNALQNRLFVDGDLSSIARSYPQAVSDKVESIETDQFLATPEDELIQHIIDSLKLDALTLYEDQKTGRPHEIKIDASQLNDPLRPFWGDGPCMIPGIQVVLTVPFSGDSGLFRIRPHSMYLSALPTGQIFKHGDNAGTVIVTFEFPADEPNDSIKNRVDEWIKHVKACIDAQKQYIEQFNGGLPQAAAKSVSERKERLRKHDKISEILDIPISRKPGAPIPIKKKIITPLPPPPKSGFKAEPGISEEIFENILSVVRNEGRSYEATPKTYAVHPEEELRDMLLTHLNCIFEGAATGETFRRKGKTDIRVEDKDRVAFVAECKIWHGAKMLAEAIDQLLGYLTWRDCKSSIILYNKNNKQISEIVKQIPGVFEGHDCFVKQLQEDRQGEWRFVLRAKEDEGRRIYCHVFVFDLYVPED